MNPSLPSETRRTLLTAAMLLASGCGPFFLEAEIPEACYTVRQQVPGAPIETQQSVSLRLPLEYELDGAVAEEGASVELLSITLAATDVADLGFLDALELRTLGGCGIGTTSNLEPCGASSVSLVRYQRSGETGTRLELHADDPVDLTEHVAGGKVRLEAVAAGRLPTNDWGLAAKACFRITSNLLR